MLKSIITKLTNNKHVTIDNNVTNGKKHVEIDNNVTNG